MEAAHIERYSLIEYDGHIAPVSLGFEKCHVSHLEKLVHVFGMVGIGGDSAAYCPLYQEAFEGKLGILYFLPEALAEDHRSIRRGFRKGEAELVSSIPSYQIGGAD
jgi:hypothetical protein